jgi:aryl-alcohol dehydrogenase-like predicted oxidoreductase
MEYRRLGDSGLVVSVVGLGCNNFGRRLDVGATRKVVDAALDAGVTLLDTADAYGESETFLGEVLQGRRDEVVLATKFGLHLGGELGPDRGARGSRWYVRRAVERSLRRLRTDHIDLYQMHRPDPATPVEETLAALTELVREGKVRYVGSSNFSAWQVADADWAARTRGLERFVSAQNEYSWLARGVEGELLPALQRFGVGLLPYFPLANGMLTGKYSRGGERPPGARLDGRDDYLTDRRFDVVEALQGYAAQRGVGLLDVAVGGLAAQPAVASVIAGATSPEQVRANAAAGRCSRPWTRSRAGPDGRTGAAGCSGCAPPPGIRRGRRPGALPARLAAPGRRPLPAGARHRRAGRRLGPARGAPDLAGGARRAARPAPAVAGAAGPPGGVRRCPGRPLRPRPALRRRAGHR